MRSTALHNTLDARRPIAVAAERAVPLVARRERTGASLARPTTGSTTSTARTTAIGPIEHRRRVLALHGDLVVVADFVGGHRRAHRGRALAPRSAVDGRDRARAAPSSRAPATTRPRRSRRSRTASSNASAATPRPASAGTRPRTAASSRTTTVRVSARRRRRRSGWSACSISIRRTRSPTSTGCRSGPKPARSPTRRRSASRARRRSITCCSRNRRADAGRRDGSRLWRVGDVETDARMLFYRYRGEPSRRSRSSTARWPRRRPTRFDAHRRRPA